MRASYTVTEPHPTVLPNSYTHAGRGGLGNFFRAPATTSPCGVPTPAYLSSSSSTSTNASTTSNNNNTQQPPRRFYSGRGGAGNARAATVSRPLLSFNEEYTRADMREKRETMSHVGRGGAGNIFSVLGGSASVGGSAGKAERAASDELTRFHSASSANSAASAASASSSSGRRL